ncbi:hypothetical protein AGMMS49928_02800 [Spirochaetia bacterium]|nr:hypothetical protein AGMMS49928_02800 [Spirochaetia bacterium]
MSIRAKIVIIISLIAAAITAANIGISSVIIQGRLSQTISQDLVNMINIADMFISSRITLLKADSAVVALHLAEALERGEDIQEALNRERMDEDPNFIALTVFDKNGVAAVSGNSPTESSWLSQGKYLSLAFEGNSVLSTTRVDEHSGELVFHICLPIDAQGRYVLSVTIPGMLFSDLIKNFRMWETGNIFILDEEGALIANYRDALVRDRINFIELGKTDPAYKSIGDFCVRIIDPNERAGEGIYNYDGEDRYCAWKILTDSLVGWSIGVAAPIREGPTTNVEIGLILGGLIFFIISVGIAFFVSGIIAKPFLQIEEQNVRLTELSLSEKKRQ